MSPRFLWLAVAVLTSSQAVAAEPAAPPAAPRRIPLVPGLTIVTAIEQPTGDYESIKRVLAVDAQSVLLHYSAQFVAQDALGEVDPQGVLTRTEVDRRVRRADLESSTLYLQQFAEHMPVLIAGTTALGTSRQVLRSLKRDGRSEITVFQMPLKGIGPPNPLDRQPGEMDFRLPGTIERVSPAPVMLDLIVNDRRVQLPAVRAKGMLAIEDSDFHFLDDETNPIALRFEIGKSKLRVIRINFPVSTPAGAGGNEPATGPNLEQALAREGRFDTYGIYFDFGSASLRPESDLALKAIADVLKKNPAWTLRLVGHTDGIGTDAYNLDLSRRRAAAARDALVTRYGVAPARLGSDGLGARQPKGPNNTLEGRALNRRVELVRGGA
jgi:outer membrane protein OmpA-like peptidoglycan-associated protein